jgi:hypothetical protein
MPAKRENLLRNIILVLFKREGLALSFSCVFM